MTKKSKDPNEEKNIPVNDASKNGNEEKNEPMNNDTETGEEILVLSKAEVSEMKETIEKFQKKAEENQENWQRERADFINYKKRNERELELLKLNYKADLLKKYLTISDDLSLAMRNCPKEGESVDAWIEGIDLILHKLEKINENEGLVKIEADGQEFDPKLHEAVTHEECPEVESGRIIEVLQNGYKLGERVIRPSLVRVAK